MSARTYQWAKRQRVGDSAAKALLKTYAHWATDDGETWVSNDELELETELNIQTIRRARAKLIAKGFLEPTRRRMGLTRSIIVYRIRQPERDPREPGETKSMATPSKNEGVSNSTSNTLWTSPKGDAQFEPPSNPEQLDLVLLAPPNSTQKGGEIPLEAPPNFDTKISIEKHEKDGDKQPARGASHVALHDEIRGMELPADVPQALWRMWCEHREAKAPNAPWTRAAARISLNRLVELAAQGQGAEDTISEAVLRGWTGLFPVKSARCSSNVVTAQADAINGGRPWWKSMAGIVARGVQLGLHQQTDEHPLRFKARVFRAAGSGAWVEQMVREAGSGTLREQLLAYFGGIGRSVAG